MSLWDQIQTGLIKAVGFLDTPFGGAYEVVNTANNIAIGQILPNPLGLTTADVASECAGAINFYPTVPASQIGTMDTWIVTGNGQTMSFASYCNAHGQAALDQSGQDITNSGYVVETVTLPDGSVIATGNVVPANGGGNTTLLLAGAAGAVLLLLLVGKRR